MWFHKYDISSKKNGLEKNVPSDFFSKKCTEKEFEFYKKYNDNNKTYKDYEIPSFLKLPMEYIKLLKYSNGGEIVNEDRQFSFFDIETIREFYFNYGFLIYAPNMLPIAFNGGGTFYVYHFVEGIEKTPIYGVHASCIGFEEDTCFLGNTLAEVLNKKCDIDDEIYEFQLKNGSIKIPTLSSEEKEKKELTTELKNLTENKNLGKIGLKEYLKKKKEIQQKINNLE